MFCPECGKADQHGQRFCSGCGRSLEQVSLAMRGKPSVKPWENNPLVAGLVIVIVGLFVALFAAGSKNEDMMKIGAMVAVLGSALAVIGTLHAVGLTSCGSQTKGRQAKNSQWQEDLQLQSEPPSITELTTSQLKDGLESDRSAETNPHLVH